MSRLSTQNTAVSAWHIDQIYLESIWHRIDVYNKGIERATNLSYDKQVPIYKECWTLLKNVFNDFYPYMKPTYEEYMPKLKKLKLFFWATIPTDSNIKLNWITVFKQAVDDLDDCKCALINAMAKRKALLTYKIELSDMEKIKRVMRDE